MWKACGAVQCGVNAHVTRCDAMCVYVCVRRVVWCGGVGDDAGAGAGVAVATTGDAKTSVAAADVRIQTALKTLDDVIATAATKARQSALTSPVLQDLVKRVGLFPYIGWQVRSCQRVRAGGVCRRQAQCVVGKVSCVGRAVCGVCRGGERRAGCGMWVTQVVCVGTVCGGCGVW